MATDATALLLAWRQGDRSALDELILLVYPELRRIAHHHLSRQRSDHTLQTTALINETYLDLVDCRLVRWQDRSHFLAVVANLMRRILVDYARARNARKRGGAVRSLTLNQGVDCAPVKSPDLVRLDDSLQALAKLDPRKSRVVELKFFGGLDTREMAEVLGVSPKTVVRDWKIAKVWLFRELNRHDTA